MKYVYVIDANNIAFRCFSSIGVNGRMLSNNMGVKTTCVFGMFRIINVLANSNKIDDLILCWDGGSEFRKKLFPQYKANRKTKEEPKWLKDYFDELKTCQEYFPHFGIKQMHRWGTEADDFVGLIAKYFVKNRDGVVTIVSDDKDYFQLFPIKGIKQFRPSSQKLIDINNCGDVINYHPKIQNRIYALTGQDKDNIPGILDLDEDGVMKKVGFGEAGAIKLLKKPDGSYKKLKEVFDTVDDSFKYKELLLKNRKQVFLSYKLSKIRTDIDEYDGKEKTEVKDILKNIFSNKEVKRSTTNDIIEYLQLERLHIPALLNKIGVKNR